MRNLIRQPVKRLPDFLYRKTAYFYPDRTSAHEKAVEGMNFELG